MLANGDVLRTGGRVHKNKTGFNLIGLFVGSEGMLGVVTEITLRLLPLPPARATLSAAFATTTQAAEAVQEIFAAGFLPSSLEMADHFTLEAARRDLGKMIVPPGSAHLLVDLDGQDESVRSEAAAIYQLLTRKKPNALEIAACRPWLESEIAVTKPRVVVLMGATAAQALLGKDFKVTQRRGELIESDLSPFVMATVHPSSILRAPDDAARHAERARAEQAERDHVNIMADRFNRDVAVREKVERALDELFAQVLAWGGVITGEHGIGLAKKRWWPEATSEVSRELHRKLKQIVDPHGILNPGKFID